MAQPIANGKASESTIQSGARFEIVDHVTVAEEIPAPPFRLEHVLEKSHPTWAWKSPGADESHRDRRVHGECGSPAWSA